MEHVTLKVILLCLQSSSFEVYLLKETRFLLLVKVKKKKCPMLIGAHIRPLSVSRRMHMGIGCGGKKRK